MLCCGVRADECETRSWIAPTFLLCLYDRLVVNVLAAETAEAAYAVVYCLEVLMMAGW